MLRKFLVYVTAGDTAEAKRLGRAAVAARMAACANVLGTITPIFWWNGQVQEGSEASLILKTREDRLEDLIDLIKGMHSYDCPCVVALPIEHGNAAFLQWLEDETAGD